MIKKELVQEELTEEELEEGKALILDILDRVTSNLLYRFFIFSCIPIIMFEFLTNRQNLTIIDGILIAFLASLVSFLITLLCCFIGLIKEELKKF